MHMVYTSGGTCFASSEGGNCRQSTETSAKYLSISNNTLIALGSSSHTQDSQCKQSLWHMRPNCSNNTLLAVGTSIDTQDSQCKVVLVTHKANMRGLLRTNFV